MGPVEHVCYQADITQSRLTCANDVQTQSRSREYLLWSENGYSLTFTSPIFSNDVEFSCITGQYLSTQDLLWGLAHYGEHLLTLHLTKTCNDNEEKPIKPPSAYNSYVEIWDALLIHPSSQLAG